MARDRERCRDRGCCTGLGVSPRSSVAIPEEEKKKTTARQPSERQDPCNSVSARRVDKWLAIEKDAEIEVATLDWGFLPLPVWQLQTKRRPRHQLPEGSRDQWFITGSHHRASGLGITSTPGRASRPLQQCEGIVV